MNKICGKCKLDKDVSEFYRNKNIKDGLNKWCKTCMSLYIKMNKDSHLKSSKKYRDKLRETVLNFYGCKCVCCYENNKEFLAIDHINGGGREHRKNVGRGSQFYKWLIENNFPKEFRLLCHNCNMSYGIYGYCPHRNSIKIENPA